MAACKLKDNDKVNIGLIGCGGIVEGVHLPTLLSIPSVTIKWACDSSVDRARRVARDWGIGQVFGQVSDCTDVDAVLVATPVGTREGILEKTTDRGWHALCEKPFATSTREHCGMLESAELGDLVLGAGYMRRYYWAVEQARKMVSLNVLGPLIEVVASESAHLERTGVDQSSYRNNARQSGGGVLMETGCHLLDQIMFVSNAKDVNVRTCEQKVWNDYEVETVAFGSVTLQSGKHVLLKCTVSGVKPVFQGIAFRCESGEIRLRLDPGRGLDVFVSQEQRQQLELPHPSPTQNHVLTAFRCEWLHFLDAILEADDWNSKQETGLLTTDFMMQCGELVKNASLRVNQWEL